MNTVRSPESHKEFLDAYFYAQRGTAERLMLGPKLRFLHRDPTWWRDCDIVNSFLDKHVDRALSLLISGESTHDQSKKVRFRLIDELIKSTQDRLTIRFQM